MLFIPKSENTINIFTKLGYAPSITRNEFLAMAEINLNGLKKFTTKCLTFPPHLLI